ncbi:uncharacterized protein ACA1_394570 [Acanthamoeba castellanii str. Neff]|uniref:Uncharacterized protein n=1 Tax=Acanthamoeba castellanii (strain ATCC 30010 / Neff) TaxID=1257118 RepID=L8H0D7_ACACF|nr:uncharacterized protein ACA1_394570 [Acanthamoeba castellanii str. Neff]ELR18690.1 hypothetical protein ACA1_394570 [Acanthamoeba castellanii str. Neff]
MAFQRSTLLALLVLVIAALFAHAQEVDLTSAAGDTSLSVRAEDEPTAAVANCALAINCGQCKSSSCGWCGDSDSKGYCENCTEKDCKKPDSCNYKYYTHNICPSEIDDVLLGVGAIIGIVVGGVVGLCCLGAACLGLIYCLCCRRHGYHHL